MSPNATTVAELALRAAEIVPLSLDVRTFPGEFWIIVRVDQAQLTSAQTLAHSIESAVREAGPPECDGSEIIVTFRPAEKSPPDEARGHGTSPSGTLFDVRVDHLIQLLEARSRTSDALPSLHYVEDPRASLTAVVAPRHHLIVGRRGVGKTALLLEARRWAEEHGYVAVWLNAHTVRQLPREDAFIHIVQHVIGGIERRLGTSGERLASELRAVGKAVSGLDADQERAAIVASTIPRLNAALRQLLKGDLYRLYVFIDDFYLLDRRIQPWLLDSLAGAMRDCDGWLKIASIERLTQAYEPSSRLGLEAPHDASVISLDVTLEEPAAAQAFLERVLMNYTDAVGIRTLGRVATPEALGRLVLASGGVPRDYLNLLAASIVVARESRRTARAIGKEDVAVAAGRSARSKKRDLEQDVNSVESAQLLRAQQAIATQVKAQAHTYFRVDMAQMHDEGYGILGQLVDLRFAHLVSSALSDQHEAGTKYEAYVLDLSEFTDVRLKRGLNVLDLVDGNWSWRLTGKGRTVEVLTRTKLREKLRRAPVVDVAKLASTLG